MTDLKSFLLSVSRDAKLREQFRKDPKGVMQQHGLSEADQQTLQSGDPERIRAAIGGDKSMFILIFVYG
jgi:hypothetical protein